MPALERIQEAFTAALDHGPAHMPQALFDGPEERTLLGMKVHANTVSHARLVALEDTFPRTRAFMGHERFNERSRQFLGSPGATTRPLALIGRDLPRFLVQAGENEGVTDLAAFEWAWLTTYHAADELALSLSDLSGVTETALLDVRVGRHPAANMGPAGKGLVQHLVDEVPQLSRADALLLTRPDAEVMIFPASRAMWSIFARLEAPDTIGNLFEATSEPERKERLSPDDFMPALVALLEAGALRRVG